MPTPTYTALANVTLGSPSLLTFSNIPATYRDLRIVFAGNLHEASSASVFMQFSGDTTATNYNHVRMSGNGSSASSGTQNNNRTAFEGAGLEQGTNGTFIVDILDYSATDKHKTALSRNGANKTGAQAAEAFAIRWSNTAAVTSVAFTLGGGNNFAAGSTFALYGIAS
jgi:hypothetical protein